MASEAREDSGVQVVFGCSKEGDPRYHVRVPVRAPGLAQFCRQPVVQSTKIVDEVERLPEDPSRNADVLLLSFPQVLELAGSC